jgi:hypothetical protein
MIAMRLGTAGKLLLVLALVVGLGWLVWLWGFCRFYVPVDSMAIVTAMEGRDLEPGQILAEPGQKGVLAEPLAEGRHFRNPILYDWKLLPVVTIKAGECGVVTAKVGKDLPPGEFLADEGQKGVWRRVLGPGKYRLNPVGYDVKVIDGISIPIGYVGAVTSLSGTEAAEGDFAGPGQKGVRQEVLHPGLYYVNPHEYKVDILEVGLNQVSLTGTAGSQLLTKGQLVMQNTAVQELSDNMFREQQQRRKDYLEQQAAPAQQARAVQPPAAGRDTTAALTLAQYVEFPSKDGFEIRLDMTVEFELLPKDIAEIYRRYGDLVAVVDKIIMPQILSVSRLKGSSYGARDFIVGEERQRFQDDLTETLATVLEEKHITVHNALIRHVSVPEEILDPIQAAALAVEQDRTNTERQATARKRAELNTEEALIEQARAEVTQETEKLVAETKAAQETEVARIMADAGRQVAELAEQTATVKAEIARCLGEAAAQVTTLVDGEQARGFEMKVKAVGGAEAYTSAEVCKALSPSLSIALIHTGPGTLWTDLKNARLADLGAARVLASPPGTGPLAAPLTGPPSAAPAIPTPTAPGAPPSVAP